jgi:hypothetical protein
MGCSAQREVGSYHRAPTATGYRSATQAARKQNYFQFGSGNSANFRSTSNLSHPRLMQAHSVSTGMGGAAQFTNAAVGTTIGADAGVPPGDVSENLIGIDEVQRCLNRSRASVYRYTNTDPRNLNPPFNPRKLNPEYRSDQKEALLFHPNEVARFARDVLRIKEVTVEVLNSPSTATQQLLSSILEELRTIRGLLSDAEGRPTSLDSRRDQHDQARPAA